MEESGKRVCRPLGLPFAGLVVLSCGVTLWAERQPGGQSLYVMMYVCLWLIALVRWLWYGIVVLRTAETFHIGISRLIQEWFRMSAAPIVFLALVGVCYLGYTQRVAFLISRPAMEQLVKRAQMCPEGTSLPNQWVGVYYVRHVELIPEGVQFMVHDSGWLAYHYGYAYLPKQIPKETRPKWQMTYHHYDGPWYVARFFAGEL